MHTQVATLTLGAGTHEIRAAYEQHGGAHALELFWAPNDGRPRPLPPHYLFRERPDEGDILLAQRAALLRRAVLLLWGAPLAIALLWIATRMWTRYRTTATTVPTSPLVAFQNDKLGIALASAAYALTIWVFLRNAWVAEDAHIIFRSVEQVFAGNGPVWNPHERVQTFTSPLWFGVLVLSRSVSTNLYVNTLVVSFALWLLTLRNLQLLAPSNVAFTLGVLLCVASLAVHDYTSSGLENVLAYALITTLLLQLVRLHRDTSQPRNAFRGLLHICVVFGLIAVTRHDLVPLMLPPAAFLVWSHRSVLSARRSLALAVAAVLPLAAWTLFSLVYYGFPWPNTAYAKLNTGIDRADLVLQGLRYLYVSFLHDPITPAAIVAALLVTQFRARHTVYRFVGLGIVLNLSYIVWIGGDLWRSFSIVLVSYRYRPLDASNSSYHITSVATSRPADSVTDDSTMANPDGNSHRWHRRRGICRRVPPHSLNCWYPDSRARPRQFGVHSERESLPETHLTNYLSRDPDAAILALSHVRTGWTGNASQFGTGTRDRAYRHDGLRGRNG